MEQLRRDIESLKAKVEEKEHELLLIQQELSVLQARLDDHISRKKVEEQNAEEQAEMQKRAEEAARLARLKAEALEREAEENKESSMQKTVVSEANDNEIITPDESEVPVVGEAQHEAIMRTIDELSKDIGVSRQPQSFEDRPTVVDRVSKQKLNDLKRGIGINERFLYANELFGGDMNAFTRAIDELNHIESEKDAHRLLNENLGIKYQWEDEDETVVAFKSLVSRRFSKL
jgi:hypothetical protein